MGHLWHNICINAFHIFAITGQLRVEIPEETYNERWDIIIVMGVLGLYRTVELCIEQWNLHDSHILALQEALEVWRALGQHGVPPDLYGGHILCITDGNESVKSTGTAWRTAWLTSLSYSMHYRWQWKCKEHWDTMEYCMTYMVVIFSLLQVEKKV
jgi:hypothetical protein